MTNNQPQVWIPGHKLLGFLWDLRCNLHNCLLNVYFLFMMLILFLYTDVRILSLFDHVDCDNKLLTYILTYLLTYINKASDRDGPYALLT